MIENNIIQSLGAGSGIDSKNLVKQLTAIEKQAPQQRIDDKKALKELQISDFGKVKSALATYQSSVNALIKPEGLFSKSASFTESNAIVPSAISTEVASGAYKFEVTSLAQSQSLASMRFASEDDAVGLGTLTFNFGSWNAGLTSLTANADKPAKTLTIDNTNNSLKGLRDAINKQNMGVTASIVNDGVGVVLLMTAESGEKNQLEIIAAEAGGSPTNTDGSDLSRFAFNATTIAAADPNSLAQKQVGKNADLKVNGLSVSRSTNSVTDVVKGLTLDLLKASPGEIVTVTVTDDVDFAKQTVRDFVDAYNTLLEELEPVLGFDKENDRKGSLANDALGKSVVGQMRNLFAASVTGLSSTATFSALTNLGIRTELDGTLSITDKEFDAAFKDNFDAVQKLLAPHTQSSSSDIVVNSFGKQTQAGEYAVVINQTPRKGFFTGNATGPGFSLDTTGKNYGVTLAVNGVTSNLINLLPSNTVYANGQSMAAAMQSTINADSALQAARVTVTVAFDSNQFVITSSKYGESSTVNLASATPDAIADLGLAAGAGTAGRSVAGLIDGEVAFGAGQVLLGKLGSATEGLSLIVGESATGSQVNFSRGVAGQLDEVIQGFLKTNGLIKTKEDSLTRDIDSLKSDQERLDRRMSSYEERLMQQFIAMENILNGLNSSGGFLDTLFKTLPFTASND